MEDEIKDEELDELIKQREKEEFQKQVNIEIAKKAYEEASKDPKSLVNATIAQNSISLINNDEKIKQKINKISTDTVNSTIDENNASNRKSNNTNYYTGREQSIDSMGGNGDTSKDKQITMHWIYSIWWYLIMCSLGLVFIAPLKVLLNWALALSPTIEISKEENNKITIEKTHRMHWLPCLFSLLFYLGYLFSLGLLIYNIIK